MKLPKAKTENVVVQNLNDETLIYNLTTNQAFCLNETSAKVFNACDGKTTLAELKTKHHLTDDIIYLALDELKKNDLLDESTKYISPFAGMNRREVIRKVGLASMIALPVISALIAPHAAHAASGGSCPVGTITVGGTAMFGRGETCQCNNIAGNANSCNTTLGGQNSANSCRAGCVCNINQPLNCFNNICLGTCSNI